MLQVAVLLSRSAKQRQFAAVRDVSGVRPQSAQVHLHCHAKTVTGEIQSGERQAATREAHPDPHTLPQVRYCLNVARPSLSLSHSYVV